jgi:phytase-like protein
VRAFVCAAAALLAIGAAAPAPQWTIGDPGQGPVLLAGGGTGARELSGISWAGGARYYAVSDKLAMAFPLSIEIDPHSGTIGRAAVEPGIPLPGSRDLEGIVYDPEHQTLLVSDEVGPGIREYRAAGGALVRTIAVPPVYDNIRKNLGLESLSMDPDHRTLWTANEETLGCDGAASSPTAGSVVRLQRFDRPYQPNGQWAYVTDPTPDDVAPRSSGVSDLVALPHGGLIVLERAYGLAGLRIRLYEVDFSGATDVAVLPSLARARYTPVRKMLLWERTFADANFEGAALGPGLDGGAHSVVLIADDGHHLRQALYALTIRPAS